MKCDWFSLGECGRIGRKKRTFFLCVLSWDGERGEGEEEKLKSANGKKSFCKHIVFLQNPVFGEV